MHLRFLLLLCALIVGCQPPPERVVSTTDTTCRADGAFVQVCGGRFTLAGQPFPIVGVNAYYLQEEASRELAAGQQRSPTVDEIMGELASLRATVVRTWAFNDAPAKQAVLQSWSASKQRSTLQPTGLAGLDHVIAAAERHGLKLILPLVNYWPEYGGIDQYLRWHGKPADDSADRGAFFVDSEVREHFRQHLRQLMRHVNAETRRPYAAEPAVLAWELVNEPRGHGAGADAVARWTAEMVAVLRDAGARQLIGSGESGYDELVDRGSVDRGVIETTVGSWPLDGSEGISFSANSALVDYASVHCYPEAWGVSRQHGAAACSAWISLHARIAADMGRPLLCGEIGLVNQERFDEGLYPLQERRSIVQKWLALAEQEANVAGVLLWLFTPDKRPDEWDRYSFSWRDGSPTADPPNRYVDLLEAHAQKMGDNAQ